MTLFTGESGSIFFVGSTSGTEIDVFSVPQGQEPDFETIDIENGLGVLLSTGIRSAPDSDFPVNADSAVPLDLYQLVEGASPILIGRLSLSYDGQNDTDGDGVNDGVDNCLFESNSNQTDADFDDYGNRCDADFNNDGSVNFLDFFQLQMANQSSPGNPSWDPLVDLDGNSVINFLDFSIFGQLFQKPPGPSGIKP